MNKRIGASLFAVVLLFSAQAHAVETTRQLKIERIIEAQGLRQMMQQQLDQSKSAASEMGTDILTKVLAEEGLTPDQASPELKAVFQNFLEKTGAIFTAKELVDTWSQAYGSGLSDADLDNILAYYQSPTGKKEVVASQVAMQIFGRSVNAESQKRLNVLMTTFLADLKSASTK